MDDHRAGYVAFVGRPNAGKSTLMNQILGSKLAITSHRPQTTRDRIVGIHSTESAQIVMVDTPGIHRAWTELNKAMVRRAAESLADADVVCWLEDLELAKRRQSQDTPMADGAIEAISKLLVDAGRPVIFVPNKIDAVSPDTCLPLIDLIQSQVELAAAIPISAKSGDGVDALLAEIVKHLPVSPKLYPEDQWTEVSERFLVAEIIREQILHKLRQEVPYVTFVEIEEFDESEREVRNLTRIRAAVIVERKAQKAIVIGKGGSMIKSIGTGARIDVQKLLECKVHLELFVKVEPEWTRTTRGLRRVGFDR